MADCKQVKKGILKSSSSFEKPETYRCGATPKEMKWDEMNILQTLHPPDKDYGHMKIDEPKTPYSNYKDPEDGNQQGRVDPHSDDETDSFDPDLLAKKINTLPGNVLPKALEEEEDEEDDEEDYGDETEEERAKRKFFEQKRKLHYNEFYAVKLARKLMEKEGDEDEEEEEENEDENGDTTPKNDGDESIELTREANSSEHQSSGISENLS